MPSFIKRLTHRTDPGLTWETLSRVFATLGVFLLPVLVLSWTNDVWELPKAMTLMLTVGAGWICYFVAAVRRREHYWSMSGFDWLVAGLWVAVGLSTLFSIDRWTSLVGISGSVTETFPVVTAFVALYFLSQQVFRTAAERRGAWGAALAGIGLALIFQMFQFSNFSLLPPSLPRANTVFSTVSNSLTDVAILGALFGATVLLFWQAGAERWLRWSIAAGVCLSWLVVMLAGRPIGWAVWAIGMIAVVLHQAAKGKKAEARVIVVAVALAAAGMIAQLTGLYRQAGLENGSDITLDTATSRAITQEVMSARPIVGSGGETWYYNFVSERPIAFNDSVHWSTRFIKASNAWWQTVASSGVLGTALLASIITWFVWLMWRRWTNKPQTESIVYGLVVVSVGISGFFTTWSLPLLGLAWLMIGLGRSALREDGPGKAKELGLGLPFGFALAALVVVTTWYFGGRYYTAEIMVRQVQAAIDRQEALPTIVTRLNRILTLNPRQGDAAVLLAGAHITQAELDLQAKNTDAATKSIQQAVEVMRTAVQRDPKNPAMIEAANNLLNRSSAYVADAVDEATQNFVALRQLEPANPIHDVGYGQTLMILRGRLLAEDATEEQKAQAEKYFSEAMAAYSSALKKKADYPQAQYAQAQAYATVTEYEKALVILDGLVRAYPEVPAFWLEVANAYSKTDRDDQAVAAFERVITLAPTDPAGYLALAKHYEDASQLDLAKATIERGVTAIPGEPNLLERRSKLNPAPAE